MASPRPLPRTDAGAPGRRPRAQRRAHALSARCRPPRKRARRDARAVRATHRARPRAGPASRRLRIPRPRRAVLVVHAADRGDVRGRTERLATPLAVAPRRTSRRVSDAPNRAATLRRATPRRNAVTTGAAVWPPPQSRSQRTTLVIGGLVRRDSREGSPPLRRRARGLWRPLSLIHISEPTRR